MNITPEGAAAFLGTVVLIALIAALVLGLLTL
jgi:hypothetical protein